MSTEKLSAEERLSKLFHAVAMPGAPCKGCGAPLLWVVHTNGKRVPYDEDAMNHFATCPDRDFFRKDQRQKAGTK